MKIVDYTGGKIFSLKPDGSGKLYNDYLIASRRVTVPFPINYYSNCVYTLGARRYLFLGRRPDGPYEVLTARRFKDSLEIKEVRPVIADKSHADWTLNQGTLLFNPRLNRACYAFWLFPEMQFFDIGRPATATCVFRSKEQCPKLRIGADVWDINPNYFYRAVATDSCVYALYQGRKSNEAMRLARQGSFASIVVRMDWDGNVLGAYQLDGYAQCIAVSDDDSIMVTFSGHEFKLYRLP